MKVLMISTDRNIFDENSAVRRRIIEYGKLADELHIVILNKKSNLKNQNFGNIFSYPTNSLSRWFYICGAIKIGCCIINKINKYQRTANKSDRGYLLITSQDPFECGLAGWFLKRKFSIPLQLQIHTDPFSPYFWKESLLNKIRVLVARFTVPRADCIRVVSERIKKPLISRFKIHDSKIVVLPVFVDVKKIREAPVETGLHKKYPQFDFIILMASRLTREKNIGLAIEAMAQIAKKYPKTGLIIVGSGPGREALELQIADRKLQKNIILEDWQSDIISYYKTADLFLLTSNYEGYGMAAVEATAAGCPVVMTDVGLAGEILIDKKDGIVVPVDDEKKLAEAILNFIENEDLRKSLVVNAGKTMALWPTKEDYLNNYRNSWLMCGK